MTAISPPPQPVSDPVEPMSPFVARHIGPSADDVAVMLASLGFASMEAFIASVVPADIRLGHPLALPPGRTEEGMLHTLRDLADRNQLFRSYLGQGYHGCITPPVIQRNVLENPDWYTAYTPYQPEIAQGRLEALLTFQTMVADLTGLPIANASLLDEGTAAAEAMHLAVAVHAPVEQPVLLVDAGCHAQTIAVVRTRAEAQGITVVVGDPCTMAMGPETIAVLVQDPATDGAVRDLAGVSERAHAAGALVIAATDLLALTLLRPPGEWGADVAVGSTQRFGVPMGYGGPHAAFFATRDAFKRHIPGRIIGLSHDRAGRPALRMALQTREQHIRREKATSNVCTAQVLLAVMAAMYAVYHGPDGLRAIAERVHGQAAMLAQALRRLGYAVEHAAFFDTLHVTVATGQQALLFEAARNRRINLRPLGIRGVGVALDETVTMADIADLIAIFAQDGALPFMLEERSPQPDPVLPSALRRTSGYLAHPVFHEHRSETEMLRYLHRLAARDLSLTSAMIPLGSCTMKLNATSEMVPVSWPQFNQLHPFAPAAQAQGYRELFQQLEAQLAEITGFARVSLQPNAGSQGEFAGLLAIRGYHRARGDARRTVCLIPTSAHGTNPASAVLAGLTVVPVAADARGNVDLDDLRAKAAMHQADLAALMITYPSTHGVFETSIREICATVHAAGGQVYMDGANMNAQVGLCRPGDFGADVCHLNLHKTFCIPHGGGGPGMGPIGVAAHLAPFLPGHPLLADEGMSGVGTVSAAPWGSASILSIAWSYITMMGAEGLTEATRMAILNANYLAHALSADYQVLYVGDEGLVAHECVLDMRPFQASAGVTVEDVAKRLIDYGFHPPTVSFPVAGTLMIEPTESEARPELDRFIAAMRAIRAEIRDIEEGRADRANNLLVNAPHTLADLLADTWDRPYTRERAGYPMPGLRSAKSWPTVSRIDGVAGDRHLVCTCPPMEAYGA
jgi:glycine dehydrogenase